MLSVKNRLWLLKQSCRLLDSSIIFGGEKTHWWCQRCNIFPCKSHFPPLSLLWLTFSVVTWDSVGKPAALWQRIAGMKISHAGIFSRLFGVHAVFGANNESENKNGNVEKVQETYPGATATWQLGVFESYSKAKAQIVTCQTYKRDGLNTFGFAQIT